MEEKIPVSFSDNAYNRLGKKTFYLFLSQRTSTAAVFLLLALVVSLAHLVFSVPTNIKPFFGLAGVVLFVLAIGAFAIAFVSAWLLYRSYGFCLTPDALKIRHGVFVEREMAIPFHQIQDISIERSFSEQMMGLSRIIISTAGHDDPSTPGTEGVGILPAIAKATALALQEELLKRADVQKVIQAQP